MGVTVNYQDKYYDLLKESNRVYDENIEFRRTIIDLNKTNSALEENYESLETELENLKFKLKGGNKKRKLAERGLKVLPFPASQ
jgi:5-bromo-4-chloroindolyl phosphate hydrolysis protein